jgi:hypothetical protein
MKARICDGNLNPNENEIKEICKRIYLIELCSELTSSKERQRYESNLQREQTTTMQHL